jgi:sulfur carrier protein ThiS
VRIELALFASLEEHLPEGEPGSGRRTRMIDLPDGTTVGEVVALLGLPDQPRVCFVDGRGVDEDATLAGGVRLAIFPPVAGG